MSEKWEYSKEEKRKLKAIQRMYKKLFAEDVHIEDLENDLVDVFYETLKTIDRWISHFQKEVTTLKMEVDRKIKEAK